MNLRDLLGWALASWIFFACGTEQEPLPIENLNSLEDTHKHYLGQKDYAQAARIRHQINYKKELAAARADEEIEGINRKYKILKAVLESEIQEYELSRSYDKSQVHGPSDYSIHARESTDIYSGPDFVGAYDSAVLAEEMRVFKDFGALYVNATKEFVAVKSEERPWSGFWYPFSNNSSLYTGENSPLAKWDAVLKKKKIKSRSAEAEQERSRGFRPDTWEGLCDALAAAEVLTPEPLQPKVIEGIVFSPGDQKALLTYAHLKYPRTVYGISYRGNVETDGTYQDLKPGAFHQLVTKVLENEKRALVIDDVAGIQVWNKPLYRYRWKIEQDPKFDFIFNVKAYAHLIKERSQETDTPTGNNDSLTKTYTYRLYVDKKDIKDSKYRVIASQWIGDSFKDHPDSVSYLQKSGEIASHSDEFNKNISTFKTLFMNSSSSIR